MGQKEARPEGRALERGAVEIGVQSQRVTAVTLWRRLKQPSRDHRRVSRMTLPELRSGTPGELAT